jgi:hypothetical protein
VTPQCGGKDGGRRRLQSVEKICENRKSSVSLTDCESSPHLFLEGALSPFFTNSLLSRERVFGHGQTFKFQEFPISVSKVT